MMTRTLAKTCQHSRRATCKTSVPCKNHAMRAFPPTRDGCRLSASESRIMLLVLIASSPFIVLCSTTHVFACACPTVLYGHDVLLLHLPNNGWHFRRPENHLTQATLEVGCPKTETERMMRSEMLNCHRSGSGRISACTSSVFLTRAVTWVKCACRMSVLLW